MHRPQIIHRRCSYIALACVVVACAAANQAAAELSPYQARVIAAGVSVHSGPGENFYPTDTLAQGDVVDVYREKSGWLAIRPPLNSFSWVSAREVKQRDGGVGEIVKDGVASRIGSQLNDKHNAAQVRLKKGELVEILGEEKVDGETWCKIAPPAGEFRWIQASLVERIGLIQSAAVETPAATPAATPPAEANTAVAAPTAPEKTWTAAGDNGAPPLISTLPGATSLGATAGSPSTASAAPFTSTPTDTTSNTSLPTKTSPAAPLTTTQTSAAPVDDFSRDLAQVELRLSRMAAAPTNLWNTERLQRDAAQLLNRAQTPADREAAQATMSKINRFAQIGRRAGPVTTNIAQAGQPGQLPAAPPITPLAGAAIVGAPLATTNIAPTTPPGGPYDATGILRPVVSRRPGAPQFALVDERGQVLSFVTPSPDVNLQPYVGQRIGVIGNRGFIAEFSRNHVTAARVTPLSDKLVR